MKGPVARIDVCFRCGGDGLGLVGGEDDHVGIAADLDAALELAGLGIDDAEVVLVVQRGVHDVLLRVRRGHGEGREEENAKQEDIHKVFHGGYPGKGDMGWINRPQW